MKLDILAFAAHPDDVEISAAGTLLKYISEGKSIGIVDLTEGELGTRGTVQTRYEEAETAGKLLGLSARENLRIKDGFFENSEENKRLIIQQIRRFQPEIVLIVFWIDILITEERRSWLRMLAIWRVFEKSKRNGKRKHKKHIDRDSFCITSKIITFNRIL
jgi:hypothetical protein